MRAACRWVQKHRGYELVIVRGRQSDTHRESSDTRIGRKQDPRRLLEALRDTPKVNPFGANSGLTVEIRKIHKIRKKRSSNL
jgi:hypothetical protein